MAKLTLAKIETAAESLELAELLQLQKKLVQLIGKQETENRTRLEEVTRNLEMIKNGGY